MIWRTCYYVCVLLVCLLVDLLLVGVLLVGFLFVYVCLLVLFCCGFGLVVCFTLLLDFVVISCLGICVALMWLVGGLCYWLSLR